MATTPQMLQAINGMQANTQAQLPVIPNNGNPGGAYNMASAEPATAGLPSNPNPLAWMEPSEYMMNIKQLLAMQAQDLAQPKTDNMNYNIMATPQGFNLQPLDDNQMQLDETLPSLPMSNPYSVQDPNTGLPVMPAQYTPGR